MNKNRFDYSAILIVQRNRNFPFLQTGYMMNSDTVIYNFVELRYIDCIRTQFNAAVKGGLLIVDSPD